MMKFKLNDAIFAIGFAFVVYCFGVILLGCSTTKMEEKAEKLIRPVVANEVDDYLRRKHDEFVSDCDTIDSKFHEMRDAIKTIILKDQK